MRSVRGSLAAPVAPPATGKRGEFQGGSMKNPTRAERKLASALRSVCRMRRQLARAFARGGIARDALVERITDRKARVGRLLEDLERRRAAAA